MSLESTSQQGLAPILDEVRPGRAALAWLGSVVRDLKRGDPFRAVTVLVPNEYAGRMALWELARDGGYLNLRIDRLTNLATRLGHALGPDERPDLDPIREASAVREARRHHADRFGGIDHPSLHAALLDLFRELRRAEVNPDQLNPDAPNLDKLNPDQRSDATAVAPEIAKISPAARAAFLAYRDYRTLTAPFATPTELAALAAAALSSAAACPPIVADLGAVVLFLPVRLDPPEARLLAALPRWLPLIAGFIAVDGLDREVWDPARRLAAALALPHPLAPSPGPAQGAPRAPLARGTMRLDVPPLLRCWRGDRGEAKILRAPDPYEEVREVLRAIAADLEAGLPLYRTAIVYRQADLYGTLVRDALDLAGLPWVSSEGARLDASRVGRCVLALLRLAERGFAREAVMEWLETGPILDERIGAVSTASWDRLSRVANVVRGGAQWRSRLDAYADGLEGDLGRHEADGDVEGLRAARQRDAADARAIAAFIGGLETVLRSPPAATWSGLVDWARTVRDRYVGAPDRWPARQRPFAEKLDEVLESLRLADDFRPLPHPCPLSNAVGEGDDDSRRSPSPTTLERGPGGEATPSLSLFVDVLEAALGEARLPTGELGQGVLVEPLAAVTGFALDRIYVVGLTEGSFPPRPPADPFFPVGRDPLRRRERHLAKERLDYQVALAAADGGVATLSTPESVGSGPSFPSRWLLELASDRLGRPLDAAEFAALDEAGLPWLRVIRSSQDGIRRALAPADLEDFRVRQVLAWRDAGRPFAEHPLARREDLPLRRARELAFARRSERLTQFDGNVSALAVRSVRLRSPFEGRPVSASAFETWAACGFRYFLGRALGVEPTVRPEDTWTIDARERGELIHAVLQRFFEVLAKHGRPVPGEAYTSEDECLIERLAGDRFGELEARGLVGHPISWENARREILGDLRAFLIADAAWRAETGLAPAYLEQAFGFNDARSWPARPVSIELGGRSETLHFRGFVDRIDLDPSGRRAFLIDYKSGRSDGYVGLKDDPLDAGKHLQLALYLRALRAQFPELAELGAAYWFVSSAAKDRRIGLVDSAVRADARLEEVLATISAGIVGGVFPQVPGPAAWEGFANCGRCDFRRICPTRPELTWERKQGDPALDAYRALNAGGTP